MIFITKIFDIRVNFINFFVYIYNYYKYRPIASCYIHIILYIPTFDICNLTHV